MAASSDHEKPTTHVEAPEAADSQAAETMTIDEAFGVFEGLYEPGYLDRLRTDADLT